MYITNIEEVVPLLRSRLRDYLSLKLGIDPETKVFKCFVHEDHNPSMHFNPKTNDETAHCFSCDSTIDIFSACSHIEGMPSSGPEWITETIPHLANLLGIELRIGEPTFADKEKVKLYKLAQDISDVLANSDENVEYLKERNWTQDKLIAGSIPEETLIAHLSEIGWNAQDINNSLMVRTTRHNFFGEDKLTFVIKDHRGRPIGFISRRISGDGPKYINTTETLIYDKSKALLGIDIALQEAKKKGLFIVEGPGDLAQLNRVGVNNVVAICGVAFTSEHLSILKSLGISKLYFALDWDIPGTSATQRIFREELKDAPGFSCFVVEAPNNEAKDADELLKDKNNCNAFMSLKKVSAFEWVLQNLSENTPSDQICAEMIPIVASEPAAVRRELLIKTLVEYTGLSYQSIYADIQTIREGKLSERRHRVQALVEQYTRSVNEDPINIQAILTDHEQQVRLTESEYDIDTIGVNYQVGRYDALEETKLNSDGSGTEFIMKHFPAFAEALSGGMSWTDGALIVAGGRANSGKTALMILLGMDVVLSDPDAIVLFHMTDDSYTQVEPRLKTNIAAMLSGKLTIGMAANPSKNIHTDKDRDIYYEVDQTLRALLSEEKLIVIDSEDGPNLSTLEKHIRYIRQRYPNKKLLCILDNSHNMQDFPYLERTARMTEIVDSLKHLTGKYHMCLIATAEYRKNMPGDISKLVLPVDDDLADARAFMYRPNAILHVYNDLHDRKEYAEIIYKENGRPKPRLLVILSKNKITSWKDRLILDLDTDMVTLRQVDNARAIAELEMLQQDKESGNTTRDTSATYTKHVDFKDKPKTNNNWLTGT